MTIASLVPVDPPINLRFIPSNRMPDDSGALDYIAWDQPENMDGIEGFLVYTQEGDEWAPNNSTFINSTDVLHVLALDEFYAYRSVTMTWRVKSIAKKGYRPDSDWVRGPNYTIGRAAMIDRAKENNND